LDRRTKKALLGRLERDAIRICARFGLEYRVLEAERANVKRRYGVCYSDGTIRIRLRHATSGKPLKYSSLVNTLCHELAHLSHFNHGPRFQALYAEILEWARRERIYQPRPVKRFVDEASFVMVSRPVGASPGAPTTPKKRPTRTNRPPLAPNSSAARSAKTGQLELFG